MSLRSPTTLSSSPEKTEVSIRDVEVRYDGSSTVPLKYRGSVADYEDMRTLGKTQVLRRNFKFYTMLGFASTLMCSWEFLLPLFVFGLTNGGTALIFWGYIAVALILILIYVSLAELASMYPTAGGQYHWVSELTPARWQKLLSYVVGWLTVIGWQTYLCGTSFTCAIIIQGLIALNVESYEWHNWHGTLLTMAIVFSAVFFNTVLSKKLPLVNGCLLVLHCTGFVAIIVTLWKFGAHRDSQVLFEFRNGGGWPSTGLSAMVGLITPLSINVGYDSSVHMSEEIQDASITLPRALICSVGVNLSLTFVMVITMIFTTENIDDLLATTTGQPFIQLFYNVTQSYVATSILTAIVVVMLFGAAITQVAATSRQLWSFARDDGVPAAAWLSHVTPGWDIPLPAVFISVIASSLLSCINLGSSAALNAIMSLGLVALLTSYLVTIACLLWRRLSGPPLPPRRWSLGRYGLVINAAGVLLLLPVWLFMFWPATVPVTAVSLNWSPVIFSSLIIFSLVYYAIRGRHYYHGPVVYVKRDNYEAQ